MPSAPSCSGSRGAAPPVQKIGSVETLGAHSPKLEAVRELLTKRGRAERRQFVVEGPTMLAEALGAGLEPAGLYVTERGAAQLPAARAPGNAYLIPDRAMARLSGLETAPGILAVFAQPSLDLERMLAAGKPLALLADIADPGNAGTLVRTAEIFGLGGAIFTAEAVEPFNPKVVRASMGAIFRLPLASADPRSVSEAAKLHGYTIVAAEREGTPLPDFRFPQRSMLAIGNERHGVAAVLPRFDHAVGIPHAGRGESLNAAIAGGIIFYAFSQQCKRPNF